MEKYRERQRDLRMAFLDLEKAYDCIPRELVWRTLIDKGAPRRYLRVLRDMYEGAKTRVRTSVGDTEFFHVEVGLHQGSAISPYLFALILDEISWRIQEDVPWCMIFADDIVLIAESAKGLNSRLEKWRKALEDKGLRNKSGRVDMNVAHRISGRLDQLMQYGSECCRSTKAQENRGRSWRNENDEVEMVWYHLKRRPQTAPVRRVEALLVDGSRRRGRPKLRWEDRLKQDMKELRLSKGQTSIGNAER
ncbi:retrovirus-related pol polyprotein LINE-1 [Tanacetum coccineum]